MTATHSKPGFTTVRLNDWFHETLADPARAGHLKRDWIKLLETDLGMTAEQRESLLHLPAKDASELQAAIARVVDHGGTIHVERPSEQSAGKLVVRPNQPAGANPQFSIGIFHCTFDANFRHWHCGWGPG
jgi:hypothetical protein